MLTVDDCYAGTVFKSHAEFYAEGLPLTPACWWRLFTAVSSSIKKFANIDGNLPSQSLTEFISKFKKGSKPFRVIIDKSVYQSKNPGDLCTVRTFAEITGTVIPDPTILTYFLSSWNQHYLENNLRDFIFKCRNNLLRTSDRLSHILKNIDDRCFLCKGANLPAPARESFFHFFKDCPITSLLILGFNKRFKISWNKDRFNFSDAYWYGNIDGELEKPTLLMYDVFRFHLWNFKLRKQFPRLDPLCDHILDTLSTIFLIKPKVKKMFTYCNSVSNIVQAAG
jgi:hypothetical protein